MAGIEEKLKSRRISELKFEIVILVVFFVIGLLITPALIRPNSPVVLWFFKTFGTQTEIYSCNGLPYYEIPPWYPNAGGLVWYCLEWPRLLLFMFIGLVSISIVFEALRRKFVKG